MADELLQVATTHDDRAKAQALARSAVRARTAACAQVSGPITSVYWWDGDVAEDEEWVVTFKTTRGRLRALQKHVEGEHEYDVPELVATPIVEGSAEYLAWVREETRPRNGL